VGAMSGKRKYSASEVRSVLGSGIDRDAVLLALHKGVQVGLIEEGESRGVRWYRLRKGA